MKRIIQQQMAINAVRENLELFDLPYKEIGEENFDYLNNKKTDTPACYTFRFETVNYIHIILDEEMYVYEDGLHDDPGEYVKTDKFYDLKYWIAKMSAEYKKYRN